MVSGMKNTAAKIAGNFSQVRFDGVSHKAAQRQDHSEWYVSSNVNYWGTWCKNCRDFLSFTPVSPGYQASFHMRCSEHGSARIDEDVAIRSSAVSMVKNSQAIHDGIWWHGSVYGPDEIDSSMIEHIGSKEAALHRALTKWAPRKPNYIYQVSVNCNATIDKTVWLETVNQEITQALSEHPSDDSIVRYINGKEAPGDMSLAIRKGVALSVTLIGTVQMHVGDNGREVQTIEPALL